MHKYNKQIIRSIEGDISFIVTFYPDYQNEFQYFTDVVI